MSSGSNRCLGWTFAIFHIRPLAISMCERSKSTLGDSELFGALLISERVCQVLCTQLLCDKRKSFLASVEIISGFRKKRCYRQGKHICVLCV